MLFVNKIIINLYKFFLYNKTTNNLNIIPSNKMKDQNNFKDIINNFNSDEEEKYINNNSYKKNKEKLLNNSIKNYNNLNKKKPRRDKFGYIINDENEQNDQYYSNNEDNDSNDFYGKFSEEENSDNNEYGINNDINTLKDIENKKINEDNIYDKIYEDKVDLSESLNNLNKKETKKYDNINSEVFRMNSFRPNPPPDSPQFINNNINNYNNNNNEKENNIININNINNNNNNYNINNNNNNQIFAETLKTKIEGVPSFKESFKNNSIKGSIYSHNSNIISLGKMTIKESINTELNNKNNYNNNNIKICEDIKTSEDSENQKEEDFLMKEELKRKKELLQYENNNIKNSDDDDGRENVVEDEEEYEEAQLKYLKNLEQKKKQLKKYQENIRNHNIGINIYNNIDNNNEEKINNDKIYNNDKIIKDMSIKLLHKYINGEDDKKEEKPISYNNLPNNNLNVNDNIYNNNINNNLNDNHLNRKNNNKNGSKTKSKSRNKYTFSKKKHSVRKNNNKILFKKNNYIKKTEINKYDSPSTKNTNYNNYNGSTKNKNPSINSFNLNSNKIKINYNIKDRIFPKKVIKKTELNQIKKNLYSPNNKTKSKLKKQKKGPFLNPQPRPKKAIDYHEKYSFSPTINKKSKIIWEKRNKNLEKNMNKTRNKRNYKDNLDNSYSYTNDTTNKKIPFSIGILLYEDAYNKKEKMKKMCLTEDRNIKYNANIKKMSKYSYNLVIERINKKINNIINKYSINGKLSIVNIIQCLSDLKIINELIKNIQIIDLNIDTLKLIIKNINEKDQKKSEELQLLEQLWFTINPSMDDFINKDIFFEFLKILFSSNNNDISNNQIKELELSVKNLLDKYNINNESSNNNEYISPLRDKNYEVSRLWPLQKLIKIFLNLKSNIKAYRNNDIEYKKEEIYNNLKQEREKELTFEPDLSQSNYYIFDKNSRYKYYNDNSNDKIYLNKTYSNISKRPKRDFNIIYERFMQEKKMHEKALEKLREIKKKKELKKCPHKPIIHFYTPDQLNKSFDYENPRIHNIKKDYHINKHKKSRNIKISPLLTSNSEIINKSSNNQKTKNNKNSNYSFTDRKNSNDIKHRKSFERTKTRPFNINNNSLKDDKNNNINIKNKEKNNNNNNIIDNIYVTIEINTPNGELKPLKIYKNQNNTIDILNEFCTENDINEEDKKLILTKIIEYQNAFFGRNLIKENNDYSNLNEDNETNSNTLGNGSKDSNKKNEEKINNYEKEEINAQDNRLKTLDDYISYKNTNESN